MLTMRRPIRKRIGDWLLVLALVPILIWLGLVDNDELDGNGEEP